MSRRLASLALIAALASSAPALAQTAQVAGPAGETIQTELVRYSDLNIRSADGQQALQHRLAAAAKRVCSPIPVQGENARPFRLCVQAAMSGAMDHIKTVPAMNYASNERAGG